MANLLRLKIFTDIFMLRKDKSLIPIALSLKVSFNVVSGFSYLAGFQFDKLGTKFYPTMIIQPRTLKILELSKNLKRQFKQGVSLDDYSSVLNKELRIV